ncbi:TPA: AI-2E family transporter, partial [Clostridioides difficile CD196]|nr:AI-2E family transporter [Clostridioides difficile CD196]
MQDKKIYLNIVLTVVVSYILIKVIDNYKYFFGVISLLMSLLTPFIIAFVLAYIFNPLVKFLESKLNFKRIYSLLLTYGVLIVILISFILFTVPSIVNSLADLVAQIPTYIDKTEQFLFDLGKSLQSVDPNTLKEYGDKIMSVMPKFSNLLIGSLGGIFSTTFSVGKFIVQFLLG